LKKSTLCKRAATSAGTPWKACTVFNPPIGLQYVRIDFAIVEYSHAEWYAVIGGFVVSRIEDFRVQGIYLFADFGTGKIWELAGDLSEYLDAHLLMTSGSTSAPSGETRRVNSSGGFGGPGAAGSVELKRPRSGDCFCR